MRSVEAIQQDIIAAQTVEALTILHAELYLALKGDIPLARLKEICAAEKDGRCVVLPCEIGGKVFDIFEFIENRNSPEIYEYSAKTITVGSDCRGLYFIIDSVIFRSDDFGNTAFTDMKSAENKLESAEKQKGGDFHE